MKYKLLKDLPLAKTGEEVITREINETSKFLMIERHSEQITHLAMISKEIIKEWLEPIVEKKTYDDLKEGDIAWYIDVEGIVFDAIFSKKDSRSNTFLTPEEAEDEHKRREWSCRKGKFIPDIEKYYYCYNPRNPHTSNIQSFKNRRDEMDILIINSGLAFRSEIECIEAIKENDLIRLFYTIR